MRRLSAECMWTHRHGMTPAAVAVRGRSDNFRAGSATGPGSTPCPPTIRSMVAVVISALSGTASIGTAGLMDALNKAGLPARVEAMLTIKRPHVIGVRKQGSAIDIK